VPKCKDLTGSAVKGLIGY